METIERQLSENISPAKSDPISQLMIQEQPIENLFKQTEESGSMSVSPEKPNTAEPQPAGWEDSDSLEEVDVQLYDEHGVSQKPKNEQISGATPNFANVMAGQSPRNMEPQPHIFASQKETKEEGKGPENQLPRRDTPLPAADSEEASQEHEERDMEWLTGERTGENEAVPEAYELQPSPKEKKLVPELPLHKVFKQSSVERHIEQTPEKIEERREEEDRVSQEEGWGEDDVSISEETPRREEEKE